MPFEKMKMQQYVDAKKRLSNNTKEWIEILGLAIDTHKSYNCGRKDVSTPVTNHIHSLIKIQQLQKEIEQFKKEIEKSSINGK